MDQGSGGAPHTSRLVGRERELSLLHDFLTTVDGPGSLLLAVGDPGAGKSALLGAAAREAVRRGLRVLHCAGHESEHGLPFASLAQLLKPLLPAIDELPGPQRDALLCAFGVGGACGGNARDSAGEQPERLLINLAVLTLLSHAASLEPVLLVVDDAQWLDSCTLDALGFLARRLEQEPVAILCSARTESVPEQLAGFGRLTVPPLAKQAAEQLLASQPDAPTGLLKSHILEHAAGNPLALVELARATAEAPSSVLTTASGTLPLTDRLEAVFVQRLAGLPEATRRALLFAAAADGPDMSAALLAASAWATGPDGGVGAWLIAEDAGLVRLESGHVSFRHPLMRSAVYRTASFAERRRAHLALAANLASDPDRRAWHLAAATLAPNEAIARALEATADRARRRGGYRVAAAALERAAELTPDADTRSRRLIDAGALALRAGEPWWVEKLANAAQALTDDPALSTTAALQAGWALAATTRQKAALTHLLPLAAERVASAPDVALNAIAVGAIVVYNMGDECYRRQVLELLDAIPDGAGGMIQEGWARAGLDPFGDREGHMRRLASALATPDIGYEAMTTLGGCAWVLDETATAIRVLSETVESLRRVITAGSNATVGQALALAQFESGAWEAAQASAQDAHRAAVENGLDMAGRAAMYVSAALLALRGETGAARDLIDRAVAGTDPAESRALEARARTVRAVVAAAEGDHERSYEYLRGLFTDGPDPEPLHYHASYYAIADLAAAGVTVGRAEDAAAVVASAERRLAGGASPRLALLLLRARALLAPEEKAEDCFAAAVGDPAGEQWPFERAVTLLEYGEWLRRRRRAQDARIPLSRALTVFEQLGALPMAIRTRAELRACGLVVPGEAEPSGGLANLTAQQLQIVRLAAKGLTNRQIAERLLLSDRTIGFHLYQAFPKLGVTSRAQLRDALTRLEGA
ncbi:LuxR family transcriptional regulator [Streptomyces flaveolus]|uniref:LuxR family transcriptional regulator n=1 Tax=Streptomyces flaveolus TaxID=67297 RepID=UPI0033A26241